MERSSAEDGRLAEASVQTQACCRVYDGRTYCKGSNNASSSFQESLLVLPRASAQVCGRVGGVGSGIGNDLTGLVFSPPVALCPTSVFGTLRRDSAGSAKSAARCHNRRGETGCYCRPSEVSKHPYMSHSFRRCKETPSPQKLAAPAPKPGMEQPCRQPALRGRGKPGTAAPAANEATPEPGIQARGDRDPDLSDRMSRGSICLPELLPIIAYASSTDGMVSIWSAGDSA